MNRLREDECYHITSLITDCLSEAEHLVRKVHSKIQGRVLDYDGSKGTQPLDRDEARKILDEAYDCASLALTYIFRSASTCCGSPTNPRTRGHGLPVLTPS